MMEMTMNRKEEAMLEARRKAPKNPQQLPPNTITSCISSLSHGNSCLQQFLRRIIG
jgi:hypothetical protein